MSGSKKPDNNKDNNKDKEEATLQQADDEINEFLRSRDSLSPAVKEYLRSSLQRNRVHPSRTPTPRPPSGNLPALEPEKFSSEPPAAKVPEAKKDSAAPQSNKGRKRKRREGGRRKRKSRRSRRKRRTKRRKRKRRNSTRRKKRS